MDEFKKRVTSGLWVALSGAVSSVITIAVNNIYLLDLTETEKAIIIVIATSIGTQISKYLNTAKS